MFFSFFEKFQQVNDHISVNDIFKSAFETDLTYKISILDKQLWVQVAFIYGIQKYYFIRKINVIDFIDLWIQSDQFYEFLINQTHGNA